MALQLKSNVTYTGDLDDLPGRYPPKPDSATLYADFVRRIYVGQGGYAATPVGAGLTFTRTAVGGGYKSIPNANGVFESLGDGVPSYVYDVRAGDALGVLIESSVANKVSVPNNFAHANYTATGLSAIAENTDPYSLTTISADSATSVHRIVLAQDNPTHRGTTATTWSITAKYAGSHRYVYLYEPDTGNQQTQYMYAIFDLVDGAVVRKGGGLLDAFIRSDIDGAWRCSIRVPAYAGTAPYRVVVGLAASASASPAAGFAASGASVQIGRLQADFDYIAGPNSYNPNGDIPDVTIESGADNLRYIAVAPNSYAAYAEFQLATQFNALDGVPNALLSFDGGAGLSTTLGYAMSTESIVGQGCVHVRRDNAVVSTTQVPDLGFFVPGDIVRVLACVIDGNPRAVINGKVIQLTTGGSSALALGTLRFGAMTNSQNALLGSGNILRKTIVWDGAAMTDAEMLAWYRRLAF